MQMQEQDAQINQSELEQQFQTQKKQAMQVMQQAEQTIRQGATANDLHSLQQAQQQLQQATQQINHMQGIAVTQSSTVSQQQLEQALQQIEQAAQTLQLVESLNNGNNSFKKG